MGTRPTPLLLWSLLTPGCAEDKDPVETGDSATDSAETGESGEEPEDYEAHAVITGAPRDGLGNVVRSSGDFDGDGKTDLLMGAYLASRVCVVPGPVPESRDSIDFIGDCVLGESEDDFTGYNLVSAGDVDRDGEGDLLVGAIGNADAGAGAGKAYLLTGPVPVGTPKIADILVAAWTGEGPSDFLGVGLAQGGDLNDDGAPDLVLGASGYDGGDGSAGGRAYVVTGPFETGTRSVADAFATFTGPAPSSGRPPPPHESFGAGDLVGEAIAAFADLDGDGLQDLALGASGAESAGPGTGVVAVFDGPVTNTAYDVADADLTLLGEAAASYTGSPVRIGGDIDGDGKQDLLVSASELGPGLVYIVTGSGDGTVALSTIDIRLEGTTTGDLFGASLGSPTDINEDGSVDILVGAPKADVAGVDLGAVTIFAGPVEAGTHAAADAATLLGEMNGDHFGWSISGSGDLTGDGRFDLVVGARDSDAGGSNAGSVYVFDGLKLGI